MRIAAPFAVLAIGYLCARLNALGIGAYFAVPYHQPTVVLLGWMRPVAPPGALDIILTAPVVLLTYAGVLMVPGIAGPAHNVDWIVGVAPITFISAGILAALAAIALAGAWRSPYRNLYLFCAAWSLLAFAPSMKLNAMSALVVGSRTVCALVWIEPGICYRGGAVRGGQLARSYSGRWCDGDFAGGLCAFRSADRTLLARRRDILCRLRGARSSRTGISS